MPRIPGAESVERVGSTRDPGLSVPRIPQGGGLEGLATTVADVADKLGAAQERKRSRVDAVERARALTTYTEAATTELRRINDEDDISKDDVLGNYGAFLEKQKQDLLTAHTGSEASKLALAERLEAMRGSLASQASTFSIQAQKKMLADTIGGELNKLATRANNGTDSIADLWKSWDGVVNDMAPGLTPDQERDFRRAGREKLVESSLGSLLDRGAVQDAKKILTETPGIAEILSPETSRRLNQRIVVAEAEEQKGIREGKKKLDEFKTIMGREPNADERIRLAGVAPPQGRQTLADKVKEFEIVTGKPATQDQIAKMAGAATAEDRLFGAGLRGRALEIATTNAPAFAAGLMTPEQENQFIASVTELQRPETFVDPTTQEMVTRPPLLPPFVSEAFKRRGMAIPSIEAQAEPQPGPGPGPVPGAGGQGSPAPAGPPQSGATTTGGVGEPGARLPSDKTIFGRASLITGPVSAAGELIGRTPILGEFVPASQITQSRNDLMVARRDLVTVLQNSPKYAEGEREQIQEEIKIEPQVFDRPGALRNRLIGIDDALARREQTAARVMNTAPVGSERRRQAASILLGLQQFRQVLGVPPRYGTAGDVKKAIEDGDLGPGDMFIFNGEIKRVKPQPNPGGTPSGGGPFDPARGEDAPRTTETQPEAPLLRAEVERIKTRYPVLAPYDFKVIDSRGKKSEFGGSLEFYSPDEERSPLPGKPVVEVFSKDLKGEELESAIFGDMLHHLPEVDQKFASMRERFWKTITPEQIKVDRRAYERAKRDHKETRSFEDWFERSRLDAYIRGYLAPDRNDEWRQSGTYTDDQKSILDDMGRYLKGEDVDLEELERKAVNEGQVFAIEPVSRKHIDLAKVAGMLYGTGHEGAISKNEEDYTAAFILANRSAIASAGFDPRVHRVVPGLTQDQRFGGSLAGLFSFVKDEVQTEGSDRPGKEYFNPTVLTHEFIHRGLNKIYKAFGDPEKDPVIYMLSRDRELDEAVTRTLHHQLAGTKPTRWEVEKFDLKRRDVTVPDPDNQENVKINGTVQDLIEYVEKKAQEYVAQSRPRGPR